MALFAQLGDRVNVARLLNNVAGANHLLGNPDTAVAQLKEAFEIFVDLDRAAEAGYVLSSLADVHLSVGDAESAETQARKAIVLLADRSDHLQEIGTAHLALGRSLLAQGRLEEAEKEFDTADDTFSRVASASHQADSWIARGDLARRGGEEREAARLYRKAAETLLDRSG
jgi:tetratricopeptide (TPR) repeat protein